MENKGRKVIHVYFISSHTNYYFGSIAALFKNFTAAELGCTRETLFFGVVLFLLYYLTVIFDIFFVIVLHHLKLK